MSDFFPAAAAAALFRVTVPGKDCEGVDIMLYRGVDTRRLAALVAVPEVFSSQADLYRLLRAWDCAIEPGLNVIQRVDPRIPEMVASVVDVAGDPEKARRLLAMMDRMRVAMRSPAPSRNPPDVASGDTLIKR